jgi:hypothetical protein
MMYQHSLDTHSVKESVLLVLLHSFAWMSYQFLSLFVEESFSCASNVIRTQFLRSMNLVRFPFSDYFARMLSERSIVGLQHLIVIIQHLTQKYNNYTTQCKVIALITTRSGISGAKASVLHRPGFMWRHILVKDPSLIRWFEALASIYSQ